MSVLKDTFVIAKNLSLYGENWDFYFWNPTDVLYKPRYPDIPATCKQIIFDLLILCWCHVHVPALSRSIICSASMRTGIKTTPNP